MISNVLLNRSHGWLYTVQYTEYIGCIYMSFLHCVFSDGSLNSLPKKIQSHTDSTYFAFLHCLPNMMTMLMMMMVKPVWLGNDDDGDGDDND